MTHKNYFKVSGVVFALIALGHLLRIINGWPVQVSGWSVPLWISWLAVVVAAYLSFWAFKLGK